MKRALVLSGGGAKGRFQYDAIKYLYDQGIRWDYVVGISVGALNGAMVAMDKIHQLGHIWDNISDDKVYTRKLNVWNTVKALLLKRRGILGSGPLEAMIRKYVRARDFKIPFACGTVDLEHGDIAYITSRVALHDRIIQNGVWASAMMGIVWDPVSEMGPYLGNAWTDGGLRDNCPLGAAVAQDPDEIYIINCAPRMIEPEREQNNLIQIAQRSLGILLNEVMNRDISEFLRINELVRQMPENASLKKSTGKPYKYFRHLIIEPDEIPGGVLDFNATHTYKGLGTAAAREALKRGLS